MWHLAGLYDSLSTCNGGEQLGFTKETTWHLCCPSLWVFITSLGTQLKQTFKQHFYLVSTDSLKSDGPTLPPLVKQRGAGCPKTKRIRHQSKYRLGEDSPIICSNCRHRGHNKRTCPNQKMLPIESATTTGNNVVVVNLPPDEEARNGEENEDKHDR